jgi:WXXGXW repeat (2 copies)
MKSIKPSLLLTFTLLLGGYFAIPLLAQVPADPTPAGNTEGIEVLARGAIHEAYAEPVTFDPTPGITIAKQPPEPIEEIPAENKPAGDHVAWMPGYWVWDVGEDDFIWVSGFWRALPPGREWVPGYWMADPAGWRWVSGYWAKSDEEELEYLPAPPTTLEAGPSTAAPSADHLWMPGYWLWREARYAWSPGYWYVSQPNWIWVPAHYVWTPRGCIFVRGYWDYSMAERGILYAPVRFQPVVYQRPAFHYCPSAVIDIRIITNYMFVRPQHCHYYFGDYYATNYTTLGIVPWYTNFNSRSCYDPLFVHHHHQVIRTRPQYDYVAQLRHEYQHRIDHQEDRPGHHVNWAHLHDANRFDLQKNSLVKTLDVIQKNDKLPWQLEHVTAQKQQNVLQQVKDTRVFTQQRNTIETDVKHAKPLVVDALRVDPKRNDPVRKPVGGDPIVRDPAGRGNDVLTKNELTLPKKDTLPDLKNNPLIKTNVPAGKKENAPADVVDVPKIKRPKSPLVFNNPETTANPAVNQAVNAAKEKFEQQRQELNERIRTNTTQNLPANQTHDKPQQLTPVKPVIKVFGNEAPANKIVNPNAGNATPYNKGNEGSRIKLPENNVRDNLPKVEIKPKIEAAPKTNVTPRIDLKPRVEVKEAKPVEIKPMETKPNLQPRGNTQPKLNIAPNLNVPPKVTEQFKKNITERRPREEKEKPKNK